MNEKTLVSCHGYSGDQNQIKGMLNYLEHHKAPLVILSPVDSPIKRMGPHICRTAGRRAYVGQISLDRQIAQMKVLLEYKEFGWFLMHDSDSVCLSPKIPDYLYEKPGVLWSNVVSDEMHARPHGYLWPRLASQPPYFCSRAVLERLVKIGPTIPADSTTPFIDWAMLQWSHAAGIEYLNFKGGISCPSSDDHCLGVMADHVRGGAIMCHSVKTPKALHRIVGARMEFNRRHGRGNML